MDQSTWQPRNETTTAMLNAALAKDYTQTPALQVVYSERHQLLYVLNDLLLPPQPSH